LSLIVVIPSIDLYFEAASMAAPARTLQDLSAAKSLEQITEVENPEAFFAGLEPKQQELIFSQLLKEHKRLNAVEKDHDALRRSVDNMPPADRNVHLASYFDKLALKGPTATAQSSATEKNVPDDLSEDADEDDENVDEKLYGKARAFQEQWKYSAYQDGHRLREHVDASWMNPAITHHHIFNTGVNPESGRIEPFPTDKWALEYIHSHGWRYVSDIMLYRIIAIFGMPSGEVLGQRMDGYKVCWDTALVLKDPKGELDEDGVDALLMLHDYKGGFSMKITGTKKGVELAFELLDYLVGKECVHTYDGIVTGTRA
jgi:hypothetical protein